MVLLLHLLQTITSRLDGMFLLLQWIQVLIMELILIFYQQMLLILLLQIQILQLIFPVALVAVRQTQTQTLVLLQHTTMEHIIIPDSFVMRPMADTKYLIAIYQSQMYRRLLIRQMPVLRLLTSSQIRYMQIQFMQTAA